MMILSAIGEMTGKRTNRPWRTARMPMKANAPKTNIPKRSNHVPRRIDTIMTATCPIKITRPCLLCARTKGLSFLRINGMTHKMERYDKTAKLFPSRMLGSSGRLNCGVLLAISRDLDQGIDVPERVSLFIGIAGIFFPDAINDKLVFINTRLKREDGFPLPPLRGAFPAVDLREAAMVVQRPVVKTYRHENGLCGGGIIAKAHREQLLDIPDFLLDDGFHFGREHFSVNAGGRLCRTRLPAGRRFGGGGLFFLRANDLFGKREIILGAAAVFV